MPRLVNSTLTPAELDSVLSLNESELEIFLTELGDPDLIDAVIDQIGEWKTPEERFTESRQSPALFRKNLKVQSGPDLFWYQDSLDAFQREDLAVVDEGWMYMTRVSKKRPQFQRSYWERPRGHSKTTDIAAMAMWAMMAAPGMIHGYACASSESQIKLLMKAVKLLCSLNPWVEEYLVITETAIKNPQTGSVCEIVAAAANSTFGETPNFVICDELTHWKNEGVWTAIYSGLAKVPDAFLVVISNAGYGKGRSWQWKLREKLREDPAWYFRSLNGPVASWLVPEQLEEQERVLGTLEFRRLWLNKWLSSTSSGIPMHQIEAATRLAGPVSDRKGFDFVIAAVDVGLVNDRAAVVFLGISIGRRKISMMSHSTFWPKDYPQGEVQIEDIEKVIDNDIHRFGKVDAIYVDNWQAVASRQKWQRAGVRCFEITFSKRSDELMAARFVNAFRLGYFEMYYDETFEGDLLDIEVAFSDVTRTYKLKAQRTENGHADLAIALSMGLMGAIDWLYDALEESTEDLDTVKESLKHD